MKKLAIFPVGGLSSRMGSDIPKWMLPIRGNSPVISSPGDNTIVQVTANPYERENFDLLFLIRYKDITATRNIMDMYNCMHSVDPVEKIGRGGALKHAWDMIREYDLVVIHNPDDVILNNITPTTDWLNLYPDQCVARTVGSIPHPYTTFDHNRFLQVKRVMRTSRVWQPAHVGVTILCGSAIQYIPQLPDEPCDFEGEVFPKMVRRGQLCAHELKPNESWFPCNTQPMYKALCQAVNEEDND